MKSSTHYRISFVALIALFFGTIAPGFVRAQSTAPSSQAPASGAAMTPSKKPSSTVQAQTPPSPGMVWANSSSKVYHKQGSKWYGKTKHGQWMTEQDAQKAGYKAAKN